MRSRGVLRRTRGLGEHQTDAPLWQPSAARIADSNLTAFMGRLARDEDVRLETYDQLYAWSIDEMEAFWTALWDECGVIAETRGRRRQDARRSVFPRRAAELCREPVAPARYGRCHRFLGRGQSKTASVVSGAARTGAKGPSLSRIRSMEMSPSCLLFMALESSDIPRIPYKFAVIVPRAQRRWNGFPT